MHRIACALNRQTAARGLALSVATAAAVFGFRPMQKMRLVLQPRATSNDLFVYHEAMSQIEEIEQAAYERCGWNHTFTWRGIDLRCTMEGGKLHSINGRCSIEGSDATMEVRMWHQHGLLHRDGVCLCGQCPTVSITDRMREYETTAWHQNGKVVKRTDLRNEAQAFAQTALGGTCSSQSYSKLPSMFLSNGKSCFHDDTGNLLKIVDTRTITK
jgi:hypothetical protein